MSVQGGSIIWANCQVGKPYDKILSGLYRFLYPNRIALLTDIPQNNKQCWTTIDSGGMFMYRVLRFKVLCHLFLLVRWAEDLRPFRIKAWGSAAQMATGKCMNRKSGYFQQTKQANGGCSAMKVGSVEVINSFNMLWYTYHRYRHFLVHCS